MDAPIRPRSIVVLLGGWSAERAVSLASGRAVATALRACGHDVRELDPAEIDFFAYPWAGVELAFIALHGTFGEDGTVQTWLDELRVPYVGSDAAASRLAMNKSAAKQRFRAAGLPTPNYQLIHANDATFAAERAAAIGYPLVVKPNAQGSSIGVSIVERACELPGALDAAFRFDPLAILEQFIAGREMTVAVLDGRALPAIEIRPARSFYDFAAKYADDATGYIFDHDLPAAAMQRIEATAISAAESLGCGGVCRVDLRLDRDLQPWLLEVNTIPGFTDHSLVPKAAARAGISFAELCQHLVQSRLAPAASVIETGANRAA